MTIAPSLSKESFIPLKRMNMKGIREFHVLISNLINYSLPMSERQSFVSNRVLFTCVAKIIYDGGLEHLLDAH